MYGISSAYHHIVDEVRRDLSQAYFTLHLLVLMHGDDAGAQSDDWDAHWRDDGFTFRMGIFEHETAQQYVKTIRRSHQDSQDYVSAAYTCGGALYPLSTGRDS